MYKDDIIAEVWRNRDAYAQKHHYNLDEIVADLRKQAHPDRIVDLRHRTNVDTYKSNRARFDLMVIHGVGIIR